MILLITQWLASLNNLSWTQLFYMSLGHQDKLDILWDTACS
jgi:hypothetical protein